MMTAGFWDLSMIPATGLPATGSVISERADASAPRRCSTPETGKSKFSPSPAFLNKNRDVEIIITRRECGIILAGV